MHQQSRFLADAAVPVTWRNGTFARQQRREWRSLLDLRLCGLTRFAADGLSVAVVATGLLAAARFTPACASAVVGRGLAAEFAACFAAVVTLLASWGHYRARTNAATGLWQLCAAAVFGLLVNGYGEYIRHGSLPPLLMISAWAAFPMIALGGHLVARRFVVAAGRWDLPVIVVGRGEAATQAAKALGADRSLGYVVRDVVCPDAIMSGARAGRSRALLRRYGARMVVFAPDPGDRSADRTIEAFVRDHAPVAVISAPHGPVVGGDHSYVGGQDLTMVSHGPTLTRFATRRLKSLVDVTAAGLLLLAISPVMLLLVVLVKLDGGPAFFAHRRIGHQGRSFLCLKFRSMCVDSNEVLREVLASDPEKRAEWAATQKLRDDPRITRIGRFLRATSLDEVPQLLNVLRLEMSLVGPRPIVDAEISRYGSDIDYYYDARPGITGLWQISGRSDTSYQSRVQLDRWYVRNWSFWHDVLILFRTVPAVLSREGAV